MTIEEILKKCDHTLLAQTATTDEIRQTLDDAMRYDTASACIPPCYVKFAKEYVGNRLKICTVIGFPNGYNTTAVKVKEAEMAVADGADEIDMVINIGRLKEGALDYVAEEIRAVKRACHGRTLKAIVETCLLTYEEKIAVCKAVTMAGADYIKTSTGFSKAGATVEDVELFAQYVGDGVKIKAAGGISSIEDAEALLNAGADRLGTSRIVKLAKELI